MRKKHFSNEIFLTLLLYSFQRTILLSERVFGSLKTDQYGVKPMTTYTA